MVTGFLGHGLRLRLHRLLVLASCVEIFVPYFLQTLHGYAPLGAGYATAAMAGGWSLGSLAVPGTVRRRRPHDPPGPWLMRWAGGAGIAVAERSCGAGQCCAGGCADRCWRWR
jgi:hypothetical protein